MSDYNELKEKISKAPHQRKSESADLVVYDDEGHWLFEVYAPKARVVIPESKKK